MKPQRQPCRIIQMHYFWAHCFGGNAPCAAIGRRGRYASTPFAGPQSPAPQRPACVGERVPPHPLQCCALPVDGWRHWACRYLDRFMVWWCPQKMSHPQSRGKARWSVLQGMDSSLHDFGVIFPAPPDVSPWRQEHPRVNPGMLPNDSLLPKFTPVKAKKNIKALPILPKDNS